MFYYILAAVASVQFGTCVAVSGSILETCVNGSYGIEIYLDQGSSTGNCTCPPWIGNQCCHVLERLQTKLPSCVPPCDNGGVCINNDTCSCKTGYLGKRCEISVSLSENLKPRLNPTLPLSEAYKPLSWYDGPEMSWANRACMVKIHTRNAPADMMFTAISTKHNDTSAVFGNFTSGPIDQNGGLNSVDRYACLQARCPGETIQGDMFDVDVMIMATSALGTCTVSAHSTVNDFKVTPKAGDSDTVGLILQYGNNYGPRFGVYVAMGFLSKASYLAQQSCSSGNQYDFTSSVADRGSVVDYVCS